MLRRYQNPQTLRRHQHWGLKGMQDLGDVQISMSSDLGNEFVTQIAKRPSHHEMGVTLAVFALSYRMGPRQLLCSSHKVKVGGQHLRHGRNRAANVAIGKEMNGSDPPQYKIEVPPDSDTLDPGREALPDGGA